MAVNIGVAALSEAVRIGDSSAERAEVTRLLAFATEAIERHLGDAYATAPDEAVNEACVRYVGYLFDQPTASRGRAFSNALVNSGAAAILLPYREIGGTALGKGEAAGPSPSPTPTPSGPAVDQVARNLADGAQDTANAAVQGVAANAEAIRGKQDTLMPPSNAEADAGTATAIRGWTAALVRRVVESIVPAWARKASPPTGVSEKFVADTVNAGISNGVQLWARAAPGNADQEGNRYYPAADDLAKDSTHGEVLKSHRNGSTFWDGPSDIPAVVQVSPGLIDQDRVPDSFRVSVLTRQGFADTAKKVHVELVGETAEVAYDPDVTEHNLRIVVTAGMRAAIKNHAATGAGSVTALTTTFRTDADVIVAGTQVINELQVVAKPSGTVEEPILTAQRQIGLLSLIPEPSGIVFADADALTKAVKTVRLHIPNANILVEDAWVSGEIQGQPALTRTKWTFPTLLNLTLSDALARQVSQAIFNDSDLEVRLTFFDAAEAGNELEEIGVNVPLVKVPAASSGGGGGRWYYTAFSLGAFTANTKKELRLRPFPLGAFANYAALRAGLVSGSITQIALRVSETNDAGTEFDQGFLVVPNGKQAFNSSATAYELYPGWRFSQDPVQVKLEFEADAINVTLDAAVPMNSQILLAVYA